MAKFKMKIRCPYNKVENHEFTIRYIDRSWVWPLMYQICKFTRKILSKPSIDSPSYNTYQLWIIILWKYNVLNIVIKQVTKIVYNFDKCNVSVNQNTFWYKTIKIFILLFFQDYHLCDLYMLCFYLLYVYIKLPCHLNNIQKQIMTTILNTWLKIKQSHKILQL